MRTMILLANYMGGFFNQHLQKEWLDRLVFIAEVNV